MRNFDRNLVKRGDRLIYRQEPEIPITFKFMGHSGRVVVTLDPGFMPEHSSRDVILRQKELALP